MARRSKKKWTLGTFFVCSGILFLGTSPFWLRKAPELRLRIRQLEVMGLSAIPSVDFNELLGIEKGKPVMGEWLKKSAALASANPRVGNVTVSRSMTGEVQVRVRERKAQALLNLDRLYYIDGEANILGSARFDSPEALDLPVITGFSRKSKKPNSIPDVSDVKDELKSAIELRQALIRSGYPDASISELHFDPVKKWILYRTGVGASFVFGNDDFEIKAARLTRVLRDFQGREQTLAEVDLDFGDRVIVKKAAVNNQKGSRHGKEG
jgi:cell division septal protein FtsQ